MPEADEPSPTSAEEKAEELFQQLMKRQPLGFAASSAGKFDGFRKWLAEELDLGDWKSDSYAVGSAGTAHNFSARWTQNNKISGRDIPLGLAFLKIPDGVDEDHLVGTAVNTSSYFVNGQRSTSFEAIIFFVQPEGQMHLKPHSIMALPGSDVAQKLLRLFPDLPVRTIEWEREEPRRGRPGVTARRDRSGTDPLQPEMLAELGSALEIANYRTDETLVERAIASLAAKRFLIFAGLSGSGKTLLGIMIARWLSSDADQMEVVAVGADWTSKHHLLGYADALDANSFVGTPALSLLLRAIENPLKPHFLILDEMNLSHVERYFSDFLSAMESGQPIHLHGGETTRNDVPASLAFPTNLFVIGTINVDETTYMFSPKVLDRANVIEFMVTRAAIRRYLEGRSDFDSEEIAGGGAAFGSALVDFAESSIAWDDWEDDEVNAITDRIDGLFAALDSAGMQFGFRTAREMVRYLAADRVLTGRVDGIRALDAQLAQRILPKLGGDAARLRPILVSILGFCLSLAADGEEVSAADEISRLTSLPSDALRGECDRAGQSFPITSEKIARMLVRLDEHGFTTAIEG